MRQSIRNQALFDAESPFATPFWKKLDLSINWTMGKMQKNTKRVVKWYALYNKINIRCKFA